MLGGRVPKRAARTSKKRGDAIKMGYPKSCAGGRAKVSELTTKRGKERDVLSQNATII